MKKQKTNPNLVFKQFENQHESVPSPNLAEFIPEPSKKEKFQQIIQNLKTKTKLFYQDHKNLLFKSAPENQIRLKGTNLQQIETPTHFNFASYSQLKKYQQKLRYTGAGIVSLILVAGIGILIFKPFGSQGATYTWIQKKWQTVGINVPAHNSNTSTPEPNWTEYTAKDLSTAITTGVLNDAIGLALTAETRSETTDAQFNEAGRVLSNAMVSGTGTAAVLQLEKNYRMVVGGEYHTLALKDDGTVWAWGSNSYGQLGDNTTTQKNAAVQVSGLSGVISVAVGANHSLALKADGTVWTWGYNQKGQIGDGTTTNRSVPVQVCNAGATAPCTNNYLTNVVAISAGFEHVLALKADGTAWGWGGNSYFPALGDGTSTNRLVPIQITKINSGDSCASGAGGVCTPLGVVTAVFSGPRSWMSYALKSDGTLWGWGSNGSTGLGINSTTANITTPTQICAYDNSYMGCAGAYITDVTKVAVGSDTALATKKDNSLWGWGQNSNGQIGDGTTVRKYGPVRVLKGASSSSTAYFEGATEISAGLSTTIAVKADGSVWTWGDNSSGQLGNGTLTQSITPIQVCSEIGCGTKLGGISAVSEGYAHSLALKADGAVYAWGSNSEGQLGDPRVSSTSLPLLSGKTPTGNLNISNTGKISSGFLAQSSFAIKNDGTVWSWGLNSNGQIGDATTTTRVLPTRTRKGGSSSSSDYLEGIIALTSGNSHTLALKSDGTIANNTVWSWGANGSGQLGNNTTIQNTTPVQVKSSSGIGFLTGITAISAGQSHSLALGSDGAVWAWGYNGDGQLGNNSITQSLLPVQVKDSAGTGFLSGIVAISAGGYHSLALKNDGTLWAWGRNGNGQLGNNSTTQSLLPVQVTNTSMGTGIIKITAGFDFSLALTSDGKIWGWGYNFYGQLGNNSTTQSLVPVQAVNTSLGTNISAISAGNRFSLALKTDGTAWAWGDNSSGQLGVNSTTQSLVPVKVKDNSGTDFLTGVSAIATGTNHSLALKADGTVWAWGANNLNQLGDYTTTQRNTPTQVKDFNFPTDGVNLGYQYKTSGSLTSPILDLKRKTNSFNLTATETKPTNTGITYDIKAGNVADLSDGSWLTNQSLGAALDALKNKRYYQYKINLNTSDGFYTPSVDALNLNYDFYGSTAPQALYHLDNGADGSIANGTKITDASGRNNHGTATNANGAGMTYAAGKISRAITFDGTDDYIDLGDSTKVNLSNASVYSVSAWINPQNVTGVKEIATYRSTSTATPITFQLDLNGADARFIVRGDSNVSMTATYPNAVAAGNWYHIVGVRDGNKVNVYVNGKTGTQGAATVGTITTNKFLIGALVGGSTVTSSFFNGQLDEVAVYNRALSDYEIAKHYNAGNGEAIDPVYQANTLTSSVYNSNQIPNILSKLNGKGSVPFNTAVKMQVRSGCSVTPNDSTNSWTEWCGADTGAPTDLSLCKMSSDASATNTNTFNFTSLNQLTATTIELGDGKDTLNGGTNLPLHTLRTPIAVATDGNEDCATRHNTLATHTNKYFQYRLIMESDGQSSPSFTEAGVQYVINDAPIAAITNNVQQGSDGNVAVAYEISDPDTNEGNLENRGHVHAQLLYWKAATSEWIEAQNVTWTGALTPDSGESVRANEAKLAVNASDRDANNKTTTPTAYSLVWNNPAAEYDEIYNDNNTFKLRLVVRDNEGANNTGFDVSDSFEFDTKDPQNVTFSVDHYSNRITFNTALADNTAKSMAIWVPSAVGVKDKDGNDLTLKTTTPTDGDYLPYAATLDLSDLQYLEDPLPVYARIKDAKGNYTQYSTTTPVSPRGDVKFYDFSDPATNKYTELIVWGESVAGNFKQYDLYRNSKDATACKTADPDNALTKIYTSTVAGTNYLFDKALDPASCFAYKVTTTDTFNNVSKLSTARVIDVPDGQGGTDTKPPAISAQTVARKSTTYAALTWTTDEIASGFVEYWPLAEPSDKTIVPEGGFTTSHRLVIKPDTGLTPDTNYVARIVARDPMNNQSEVSVNFKTDPGPKIFNVTPQTNLNNESVIYWKTDVPATSKVYYSANVSAGALVNPMVQENITPDTDHSVVLPGLSQGTIYYHYVESRDASSNIAFDDNGENFWQIMTTMDSGAPQIQNLQGAALSQDTAAITWSTNQQANGQVTYREVGATRETTTPPTGTFDFGHYVLLTGLKPDTQYEFKVSSTNPNGKEVNSNYGEGTGNPFTTEQDPSKDHPPLNKITFSEPNPSVLTDTDAVLSFKTTGNDPQDNSVDVPANCFVEYGTTGGVYDALPKNEAADIFSVSHGLHLLGLLPAYQYYYRVTCEDNLGTSITSDERTFTTKEKMLTGSEWGNQAGSDVVPPTISNVRVTNTTGESVTIEWDTDEAGSSSVRYGVMTITESGAIDSSVNNSKDNYATTHKVVIDNLIPGTKYLYTVLSADKAGNIGESSEAAFTTAAPSSLSSIKAESKNLGEATITWNTDTETTSIVEYGLSTSYGEKKESNTQTKEHSINLSNLNQGALYHYRVKGKDQNGKLYASSDQTFEPKSPPKIENIEINSITEHEATVSFKTNVPTTANATYTDIQNPQTTGSQGDSELATEHKIILKNLAQGTTFALKLEVKDEQGTASQEDAKDFTTGKDENPPKIDRVKSDMALTQSDKVQTIISWTTDEQASTSIVYKEGKTGEKKELKVSDNLTTSHVAVITSFKSGTVYYFNVKSTDSSNNEAVSNDFALLTPRRRENIIQIIINNFQEIFGWARR